jgi:mono/diheme cytochrome c family protein
MRAGAALMQHRWLLIFISAAFALLALEGCRRRSPPASITSETSPADRPDGEASATPPPAENTATPAASESSDSASLGKTLYARHCAACHGERGDGQGIAARFLFPKPRDFRAGRFRLVSTANSVPSAEDLHGVLLRGMPGSSMPPWKHLSEQDRTALVDEVMRLRREGAREIYTAILKDQEGLTDDELADEEVQQEIEDYVKARSTPGASTEVPELPPPSDEALARGKEIYAKTGCLQCHGATGKGDGVQKMVDDEKLPTAPRDFTLGIFKGGDDFASVYRRIAYGMPGTPMPSANQLSPEERGDLAHYILAMSTPEQRQAAVLNREEIVAARAAKAPDSPDDPTWSEAAAARLRMTPLWWRNDADPDLEVRAVHDGTALAVMLSWKDSTENVHAMRSESFEDAAAIQFSRGAEPFLGMGAADAPVDVWFWDADRQSPADVDNEYPNVVVDIYPFSEKVVATAEYQREGAALAAQPEVSLPALASGNQIVPGGAATGGSQLSIGGPGSVTFRLPKSQLVKAIGRWQDGRWSVVMTRSLEVASEAEGLSLQPGGRVSAAFAVWDGALLDRDGKKLITIWQDLVLEP